MYTYTYIYIFIWIHEIIIQVSCMNSKKHKGCQLKQAHVNYLKTGHLCCYRFHVILFVHVVEFHPLLTQVEGTGFRAEEWDGKKERDGEKARKRERDRDREKEREREREAEACDREQKEGAKERERASESE